MKFEANKEFMGNLSLQFGQTTDGGTKYLHVDVSLAWMGACQMKGLIYMPTLASVALLFYKGGFYGSAHVQAMTLGYILKTK